MKRVYSNGTISVWEISGKFYGLNSTSKPTLPLCNEIPHDTVEIAKEFAEVCQADLESFVKEMGW